MGRLLFALISSVFLISSCATISSESERQSGNSPTTTFVSTATPNNSSEKPNPPAVLQSNEAREYVNQVITLHVYQAICEIGNEDGVVTYCVDSLSPEVLLVFTGDDFTHLSNQCFFVIGVLKETEGALRITVSDEAQIVLC